MWSPREGSLRTYRVVGYVGYVLGYVSRFEVSSRGVFGSHGGRHIHRGTGPGSILLSN